MKKTIYYSDELTDDFAVTKDKIKVKPVTEDFVYLHKGLAWHLGEFLLHQVVATPLVYLFCKLVYGLKIYGKENLKEVHGGCYLYGNHTHELIDSFVPSIISFPRKARVITANDAVSVPGLKHVVQMLGVIPLPNDYRCGQNYIKAVRRCVVHGNTVTIYPEAHIWPYYNGIRPFGDHSFTYPARDGRAAIPVTMVYRRREVLHHLPPCVSVYIGKACWADGRVSMPQARKKLRDQIYREMCETVITQNSYEYIHYEKEKDNEIRTGYL